MGGAWRPPVIDSLQRSSIIVRWAGPGVCMCVCVRSNNGVRFTIYIQILAHTMHVNVQPF